MNYRFSTYVKSDDGSEIINRENVWHFYAYFASEAVQLLQEFMEVVCDIPDESKTMSLNDPISKGIGKDGFDYIMKALVMLVDYYKYGELIVDGREINFEEGDTFISLTEGLHILMNLLPYLNLRHYALSKERYDELKYHQYSFDELQHLDRTLAKRILPTFNWFAGHSIFHPKYFGRMYDYPKPWNNERPYFSSFTQWNEALKSMVTSWEWLRDREQSEKHIDWEDVLDEIYYGLHLFAEYLPEMQND